MISAESISFHYNSSEKIRFPIKIIFIFKYLTIHVGNCMTSYCNHVTYTSQSLLVSVANLETSESVR